MEGAFGVTIALIDIEPCETERRCSRSQVDSGGPAPVPEWEKVWSSIVAWDALLRHCEITQARVYSHSSSVSQAIIDPRSNHGRYTSMLYSSIHRDACKV